MNRTFFEMKHFTRKWYSLGFSDNDLIELQNMLLENPKMGDVISGTGGLRKIRNEKSNLSQKENNHIKIIIY